MARPSDTAEEKLDPSLVHKKKARRRLVGALAFLSAVGVSLPFILDSEPKSSPQEVVIHVPAREPLGAGVSSSGSAGAGASGGSSANGSGALGSVAPSTNDSSLGIAPPPILMESGVAKGDAKREEGKKSEPQKADSQKSDAKNADSKNADSKKDERKKDETKKDDLKKDSPKKDDPKLAKSDKKPEERSKAYNVQIGAFSSEDSAKEQQDKASKLGLKAYTEKLITASGTRVRVRVGPFSNREQADQALAKLKLNGVDAAIVAP